MEKLFENQQTLSLFLIFFLPGFISLKVYDLHVPGERRDFSKDAFDAVAYSALNFAALSWLIGLIRSGQLPLVWWYISVLLVLVGCPVVWPLLFLWLRRRPWIANRIVSPHPRVWDTFFERRNPYWVIVHLKDQRRIAGLYGDKSHTSSSPADPEIYLEQVWKLDENDAFVEQIESTAGILIFGEEILALEFFEYY
ncbi:MAG TPA: DUF6338 family protein [Bryobacteraceae bacterium]|jgi:hypothetical protein|nr:DUF6338 family protein [Bryobacteraceae bacterium]